MRWSNRKNGISVLIACQNEEKMVSLCIRSFLNFGDELIVVDNGSQDRTKEIVRELEASYPEKIKFYDVPDLPDLYQNRQYALERSSYRWIIRVDADFVAYTDGKYDILKFREFLLSQDGRYFPQVYGAPLPNVTGSFRHTGFERPPEGLGPNDPGRYVPPPITKPTLRVYEYFPGFKFKRRGRWEATSFFRLLYFMCIKLDYPLWMHCNIKSELNYLYRSERTNWREQGDFNKYPTLHSYVQEQIVKKYGTADLDEAAKIYLNDKFLPFLQVYDPQKYYPYPKLIREHLGQ